MAGESTRSIGSNLCICRSWVRPHLVRTGYPLQHARSHTVVDQRPRRKPEIFVYSVRQADRLRGIPVARGKRAPFWARRTCATNPLRMADEGLAEGRSPGGRVKRRVDVETIHLKRHATSFDAIADLPVLATRIASPLPTSSYRRRMRISHASDAHPSVLRD